MFVNKFTSRQRV
ncbi:hypothetical protein D030_3053A, partial [Vibrio parahaemolyticus AQ3810]